MRAPELVGDLERAGVAGGQQRRGRARPRRGSGPTTWITHRAGIVAGRRPAGVAGGEPVGEPADAVLEHRRSARAVDRPVDATAAAHRPVGGVDHRVDLLLGDVAPGDRDLHASSLQILLSAGRSARSSTTTIAPRTPMPDQPRPRLAGRHRSGVGRRLGSAGAGAGEADADGSCAPAGRSSTARATRAGRSTAYTGACSPSELTSSRPSSATAIPSPCCCRGQRHLPDLLEPGVGVDDGPRVVAQHHVAPVGEERAVGDERPWCRRPAAAG